MDWGPEAFARARAEGKPVLLHIGATWCRWCHVMDEHSYTHPRVAQIVSERFVPVRVDTDHRPDVNDRYNQGGWPTLAILDADGEVLMGRTFVPAQELVLLLQSVVESGRWSIAPSRPEPLPTDLPPLDDLRRAVQKAFDPYHGGFGDFQKFPHFGALEWLLDTRLAGGDDEGMLARTLDAMAAGGVHDAEQGGFFRYATQDDWSEPHYEKMLEDNARFVAIYTRAAEGLGRPEWRVVAERVVAWALGTLWLDDVGAFGGSQDADDAWYARPVEERGEPPSVDRTVYAGWNGLMVAALVRGSATWGRPGLVALAKRVGAVLRARIGPDGRVSRTGGDVGGFLSDQAEVAEGLLALGQRTGDPAWIADATRALAWARDHLRTPDGGFWDREAGGEGLLRIQRRPMPGNAAYADACRRLAALTSDDAWLAVAKEAATAARAEGVQWGFMAAAAGAVWERVETRAVVVKVHGAPALLDAALADAHPGVSALAATDVPQGTAQACTRAACARPTPDLAALRRDIRTLSG